MAIQSVVRTEMGWQIRTESVPVRLIGFLGGDREGKALKNKMAGDMAKSARVMGSLFPNFEFEIYKGNTAGFLHALSSVPDKALTMIFLIGHGNIDQGGRHFIRAGKTQVLGQREIMDTQLFQKSRGAEEFPCLLHVSSCHSGQWLKGIGNNVSVVTATRAEKTGQLTVGLLTDDFAVMACGKTGYLLPLLDSYREADRSMLCNPDFIFNRQEFQRPLVVGPELLFTKCEEPYPKKLERFLLLARFFPLTLEREVRTMLENEDIDLGPLSLIYRLSDDRRLQKEFVNSFLREFIELNRRLNDACSSRRDFLAMVREGLCSETIKTLRFFTYFPSEASRFIGSDRTRELRTIVDELPRVAQNLASWANKGRVRL